MDFWQWLITKRLIDGNADHYNTPGMLQDWEYGHAIKHAFSRTIVGGTLRKQLVDYLWGIGIIRGDRQYWYDLVYDANHPDIQNLYNAAAEGLPGRPGGHIYTDEYPIPSQVTPSPNDPNYVPPPDDGDPDDPPDENPNDPDPDPVPVPSVPSVPSIPEPEPLDYHAMAKLVAPWLPDALIGVFADAWAEYDNSALGLAAVRQDPRYDSYFPGNRRPDGSLRMTEQEYLAQRGAYSTLLLEYGLNPGIFESNFTDLIAGDVSAAEFAQRLEAAYSQIVTNFDEVRQVYSKYYGIEMSNEAIFASFLDENTGQAILERRIAVSQVGGAAAVQSYMLGEEYASRLVNAGMTQQGALQFFGQASNEIPTLQRLATRYNDPDASVDVEEYTEFGVFQNAQQTQRFRRLRAAESSAFTAQEFARFNEQGALTGLRQR